MSNGLEFDEFFRSDLLPLIAFLRKAGFEREDAQDAAAEAMTCAFRRWRTVQQPRAWVRKVAFRIAARQVQRSRDSLARTTVNGLEDARHQEEDQTAAVDERLRILNLLNGLPHQQRIAMAWHLEGFSAPEIAEHMEIQASTVRSALRYARQKLRAEWHGEGGAFDGQQR